MSVELDVLTRGEVDGVEAAWELKERIRREEDVFRQPRGFFRRTYRLSNVYRLRDGDDLIGFEAVRRDGYVMLLAVAAPYRGQGLGRRLVERAVADHGALTCHVRAANGSARGFYDHLGFVTVRCERGYYEDGTDALFLRLAENADSGDG